MAAQKDGAAAAARKQLTPNSSALALTQTIAKEKRVEYQWALRLVQRQSQEQEQQQQQGERPQQEQHEPAGLSPLSAPPASCSSSSFNTTTLAAASPSERLSRRLALSINPGWISSGTAAARSAAAEAFRAPGEDADGALLLRAQRDADAAAARAMAMAATGAGGEGRLLPRGGDFRRRRDAFTAHVEAAAKARLVARGGYGGKAAE